MTILDDGSNGSLLVTLIVGTVICATLSAIRALRHIDEKVRTAWDDAHFGDGAALLVTCPCDECNAFYGYRPNTAVGRPWWKP